MDLKCAECVLIVCSCEDDSHLRANQFQHLEAIEFRHLDVEEQQVRLRLRNGLDRLEAVCAFGNYLYFRVPREQFPHHAASQFFVVDYDCLHTFVRRRAHWATALSQGNDSLTSNRSLSLFTTTCACFP